MGASVNNSEYFGVGVPHAGARVSARVGAGVGAKVAASASYQTGGGGGMW